MMSDPIPSFTPPPNKPSQIRCPLTLKRLDQIPKLSDEHIIHEAIGGPRWYSVKADVRENSRFGTGPDSRFLNCDVVKLWRVRCGILGKSDKELSVTLKGTIKGKDQKVEVTFKKNSVEVDYVPRVTRDLEKGTARLIVSSNRVEEELARVTRDFARKHIRLTVASETSIPNPELDLIIPMNVPQIWAGALKVAYLAAFDFLGDSFLDDPLNSAWRQVIEAKTMDTLTQSPIPFQIRLTGAIPCPLQPTQHFVFITAAGAKGRQVIVYLFGGQIGIGALLSEKGQSGVPDSASRIIYCDAEDSTVRGFDPPPDFNPPLGISESPGP
jgi:hypothetical protein